jgi:hypothetical protein
MLKRLTPLIFLTLTVGCATDVRNFSISAKNDTSSYITLNPAKDVPQNEDLWASPEDLDQDRVRFTPETNSAVVVVPPGKTASTGDLSGHFPEHVQAILRVYRGKDLPLRELVAMQPGTDRQDVVLQPGGNRFVVHEFDGKLSVERLP